MIRSSGPERGPRAAAAVAVLSFVLACIVTAGVVAAATQAKQVPVKNVTASGPPPPAGADTHEASGPPAKAPETPLPDSLIPQSTIDQLVASERAFAAMSGDSGIREAFVHYLADDAIVFRPLPQNGKKLWESRGHVTGRLAWEPAFAEISASGDFGYTTGPWRYQPTASPDSGIGYGDFISVWQKSADGMWRVSLDMGVTHPKPESGGLGAVTLVKGPEHTDKSGTAKGVDFTAADRQLSKEAGPKGLGAVWKDWATADVRTYFEGQPPMLGVDASQKALARPADAATWIPRESRVASSGDLGYSYGLLEFAPKSADARPDTSTYLHVWRLDSDHKQWRIALAIENLWHRSN